jgi:perosamine synthetase
MIPVYRPYIEKYTHSAEKQLRDGWISNHGMYLNLTSDLICRIFGIRHCILMNTGTAATECLLQALLFLYPKIQYIYIPDEVFIAPWSMAYKYFGARKIIPLQVDHLTMNMNTSEDYLLSLKEGSAIFCVHNLGSIVNVPRIKRIRPDLVMIEDNCEGIFGKYEGSYSGTSSASLASACSFYGNKTITSGEGGAFLTNDSNVYEYIKKFHSHGMGQVRYVHDIPGHNFRMTNIQAALLYEQLLDIEHILSLKKVIINNYELLLATIKSDIQILSTEDDTEKSNWMMAVRVLKGEYDSLEKFMLEHQIQIRPFFCKISEHAFLDEVTEKCSAVNSIPSSFGVVLPSYPGLTSTEQQYIISTLKKYLDGRQ